MSFSDFLKGALQVTAAVLEERYGDAPVQGTAASTPMTPGEMFDLAWGKIGGESIECVFDEPMSLHMPDGYGKLVRCVARGGNRVIAYKSSLIEVVCITYKEAGMSGAVYGNRTALKHLPGVHRPSDTLTLEEVRLLLNEVPLRVANRRF